MRWCCPVLLLALAVGAREPATPVVITVRAGKGQIIPQSKGGGGFQRNLRFSARPARAGRFIMQRLHVRGTVFDKAGRTKAVHLDVVEYYRVSSSGRAVSLDTHYSQFWSARGGNLTISATLTYGTLAPIKRGDVIAGKSFVLRGAVDADGNPVTMKTRTRPRQVIPAERGKRVVFRVDPGSIPTRYSYRVQWDARFSRTKPAGTLATGTWWIEAPKEQGYADLGTPPRPIPPLK